MTGCAIALLVIGGCFFWPLWLVAILVAVLDRK